MPSTPLPDLIVINKTSIIISLTEVNKTKAATETLLIKPFWREGIQLIIAIVILMTFEANVYCASMANQLCTTC